MVPLFVSMVAILVIGESGVGLEMGEVNAGCRMQDAGCRMQDAGFGIRDAEAWRTLPLPATQALGCVVLSDDGGRGAGGFGAVAARNPSGRSGLASASAR